MPPAQAYAEPLAETPAEALPEASGTSNPGLASVQLATQLPPHHAMSLQVAQLGNLHW